MENITYAGHCYAKSREECLAWRNVV